MDPSHQRKKKKGRAADTVRLTIPAELRLALINPDSIPPGAEDPAAGGGASLESSSRQYQAYRALLKTIYDALLITDAEGRVVEVNSRACHLLKYSREEFAGAPITHFINGAGESLVSDLINSTRNEAFTLIEAYCVRKNGMDFPAEIVVHAIELGADAQLCFFMRDISRRIQMEKELIRLSKAVESTGDAIAITDHRFRHIYHNAAFRELLGIDEEPEAMVGFGRMFDDAGLAEEVREAIAAGRTWSGEVDLVARDGNPVPALFRANAIRLEDGSLFGAVAIMSDITNQKRRSRNSKGP